VLLSPNYNNAHYLGTVIQSILRQTFTSYEIIVVDDGSTDNSREVEKRALDLGVSHAVHFTGLIPHANVPRYMASADVAVVPYPKMDQENWLSPLKLFEYMASGRAIVASSVGQVAEIVQHERNGLLISPGDVIAMSDAIKRLLADNGLRTRLGQKARQDAMQKHSWETYISRLEDVFYSLVPSQAKVH
jgi:alpha-maltose-1-phosphate synthase